MQLENSEFIARKTIYRLMIVLSVVSLVAYSGVLSSAKMKPAFMFLAVPFASWVVIAIVLLSHKVFFSQKH